MQFFQNLTTIQKILIVVAVGLVGLYLYNMFMGPPATSDKADKAEGMANVGDQNVLKCTMYYVNWCPHCKNAKPHWEQLEKDMHGKVVNGKKVLILKVDCEADPEEAEKQGITSYPTFKFDLDGQHFTYQDEHVFDKMKAFIQSVAYSNNF